MLHFGQVFLPDGLTSPDLQLQRSCVTRMYFCLIISCVLFRHEHTAMMLTSVLMAFWMTYDPTEHFSCCHSYGYMSDTNERTSVDTELYIIDMKGF